MVTSSIEFCSDSNDSAFLAAKIHVDRIITRCDSIVWLKQKDEEFYCANGKKSEGPFSHDEMQEGTVQQKSNQEVAR
jgi:hypothetical protein